MTVKVVLLLCTLFITGLIIPEPVHIPVQDATSKDWNPKTFWYEPWGTSGTHKGMDIFAPSNTPILAATNQLILFRGTLPKGGHVIVALGPKWRLHYYAHLTKADDSAGLFVSAGSQIGFVGDTGNAKGTPPHLHYSLLSLIPLPWLIDGSTQGFLKALYLDPIKYFTEATR